LGKRSSGNLVGVLDPEASVDRSLRRHGQFLVAVGAVLGALVGIVLGLAVEDPQASTAVAAPGRATPPRNQPTAAQPAGPRDQADADASTGTQRTRSANRPDKGQGRAHKDSNRKRETDNKEPRKRANGKPGEEEM
jgi:hypothetical protein